jgi:hypothetical protein
MLKPLRMKRQYKAFCIQFKHNADVKVSKKELLEAAVKAFNAPVFFNDLDSRYWQFDFILNNKVYCFVKIIRNFYGCTFIVERK